MNTRKWILLGCGLGGGLVLVCGGIIAAIVYFVFALTNPPVEATEQFLALRSLPLHGLPVNNQATLVGSVTTTDQRVIPVTVQLVFENGQWRVLSLNVP